MRSVPFAAHREHEANFISIKCACTREGPEPLCTAKPFVLIPDSTLTIGLYPVLAPSGAIGEVVGAQEKRQKAVEIGNAQAW